MTSRPDRLPQPRADHRCSELCTSGPRDVAHREVPDQFTPDNGGDPTTPTLTFQIEQHDELDAEGNVEGSRVTAVLGLGSEVVDMDLDELDAYCRALCELGRRGRGRVTTVRSPAGR